MSFYTGIFLGCLQNIKKVYPEVYKVACLDTPFICCCYPHSQLSRDKKGDKILKGREREKEKVRVSFSVNWLS